MRGLEQRCEQVKRKMYRIVMRILGGSLFSRGLKRICGSPLSKPWIPLFIKVYRINRQEIDRPLKQFGSLTAFFVRNLPPGLRPIDPHPAAVVSPVDGYVQTFGDLADDCTFEVKGRRYSFEELTSRSIEGTPYAGGKFIILYLSPAQYHHFHSPVSGEGRRIAELGQRSLPVNRAGWRYGGRLLALNHRVIFEIRRRSSSLLMIAVGALNVNSIQQNNRRPFWNKGEEVGHFSWGSTVVCLFERGEIEWREGLSEGDYVQVGERMATLQQSRRS
ncbi:phosphatidylserine decarboxylase [Saccharibacillus sp. O16]|nr:phosphatidylserine decarboxylase [Saccharibacillus sp. O16]